MKHIPCFTRCALLAVALLFAGGMITASEAVQSDTEKEKRLLDEVKKAEAAKTEDSQLVAALDNLASFYKDKRRYEDVLRYYQRSLDVRRKRAGAQDQDVAIGLNNLAWLYQNQDKLDKAASLYWEAVKILDKLRNPEHPEMIRSLHSLVAVYRAQGKLDEEEKVRSIIPIFYEIKGVVAEGKYESMDGDYKVVIPGLLKPGARVRDEDVPGELSQVIFTDDLGSFYRIISLKNDKGDHSYERILSIYPEARGKQKLETVRGLEVHFIDVEKEGAEIVVKTFKKEKDGKIEWKEKSPDLVTVNCIFQANNRFYHVVAGVPLMQAMTEERAITLAKERLEKLLAGLTTNAKTK